MVLPRFSNKNIERIFGKSRKVLKGFVRKLLLGIQAVAVAVAVSVSVCT